MPEQTWDQLTGELVEIIDEKNFKNEAALTKTLSLADEYIGLLASSD